MNDQNVNRLRVKEIVSLAPGIHLRMLQRLLGTSFTTARYHVHNLEREGEIVRSDAYGYSRLFPAGMTDELKAMCACLQNKTARKVLKELMDGPKCSTQADLSEKLHLSKSTTSECIAFLSQVKLIGRYSAPDARLVYEVRDRQTAANLLALFSRNPFNVASDNLIDLWDI